MALQASLIFLIIASAWAITQVSGANSDHPDCCLQVSYTKIPYNKVERYIEQSPSNGCYIEAVVFVTHRKKFLCAPPNEPWVKQLIKRLDKKRKGKHHQ
ncbi:hypothetical protein FKM82_000013 [Ascaphus truei]|uniref:C-C motif chemokine 21-like n=1 Tax=Ascaphus truei TaxID=8439 RepID=UPI003F5A3B56